MKGSRVNLQSSGLGLYQTFDSYSRLLPGQHLGLQDLARHGPESVLPTEVQLEILGAHGGRSVVLAQEVPGTSEVLGTHSFGVESHEMPGEIPVNSQFLFESQAKLKVCSLVNLT